MYTYTSGPGDVFQLPKGSDFGTMRAGRYEAWRIGSPMRYEVDVPDGWRGWPGPSSTRPRTAMASSSSPRSPKQTMLAAHPCRDHSLRPVGPTVRDFTRAMREAPTWKVSSPQPITLDGKPGAVLRDRACRGVDPARCVDGAVSEYESGHNGMATTHSYQGRWWVLEDDGQRLVVMARCCDTCTELDLDTMSAMAASITFQ